MATPEESVEEEIKPFEENETSDATDRMRMYRDRKLQEEIDIHMRNYLHSGQAVPQAWIDYRQELLDLPKNQTPSLDGDNELTDVTWPTKPA